MGRSPRTTRARSWWTCRSASGAGCRSTARAAGSTRGAGAGDRRRPPARGRVPVPAARGHADGGPAERVLRGPDECPGTAARPRRVGHRLHSYPALLAAARADARRMDIGWIIVWQAVPGCPRYLAKPGSASPTSPMAPWCTGPRLAESQPGRPPGILGASVLILGGPDAPALAGCTDRMPPSSGCRPPTGGSRQPGRGVGRDHRGPVRRWDVTPAGCRFGPQAIRFTDYLPHDGRRPHLALGVDPLVELGVVDVGRRRDAGRADRDVARTTRGGRGLRWPGRGGAGGPRRRPYDRPAGRDRGGPGGRLGPGLGDPFRRPCRHR